MRRSSPYLFVPDWVQPAWHLFVIRHPRRDFVQQKLAEAEVGTLIHYPVPAHLSGAYASKEWSRGPFPLGEELANTALSLPVGPHISLKQAAFVAETLKRATLSL